MVYLIIVIALVVVAAIAGGAMLVRSRRRAGPPAAPPAEAPPAAPPRRHPSRARRRRPAPRRRPAAPVMAEPPAAPAEAPPQPLAGRMARLRGRLARSQTGFGSVLLNLLSRDALDDQGWEEIEDTLVSADLGAAPARQLVDELRTQVRVGGARGSDEVRALLRATSSSRSATAWTGRCTPPGTATGPR